MRKLILRYEWLIIGGLFIGALALLNVLNITNFDSDLFWAMFGAGAAAEAILELWVGKREEHLVLELTEDGTYARLGQLMNEDPFGATVTIVHSGVGITTNFQTFRKMVLTHLNEEQEP